VGRAVPDPGGPAYPPAAEGVAAPRCGLLPFPTTVVTSEDDPYGTAESAAVTATHLGAAGEQWPPRAHQCGIRTGWLAGRCRPAWRTTHPSNM